MPHVHNGLHEYTRLLDGAARAIGEKSGAQDFTGIERFGETLTPTINLWELPEWALLRGERLFSRKGTVAALAANFSGIEIVNPAGSGVLAVVLELVNGSTISMDTNIDVGGALGAVATRRGVPNDARLSPQGEISRCAIVEGQLGAGLALPQDQVFALARIQRPYILPPGSKLFFYGVGLNTAIGYSVFFTERALLPTEDRA